MELHDGAHAAVRGEVLGERLVAAVEREVANEEGRHGACGRELCCSSWLTDFRSVSTSAARYQQLSINPQKLAGQWGKLKCCLNYELDGYMEAIKEFPNSRIKLNTKKQKRKN